MDFYAVLDEVVELLRGRGRVSYRALKEHFGLDNERLDALRTELLYVHAGTVTEDGQGLTWTAERHAEHHGERRQLTMFFCDLVGSTTLASQFDPEEWREIMGAYYDTCGKVIARFDGHIAQYLGDGLLVYFGYPQAHEDDAQRAVRAGLGIIEAIGQLNTVLSEKHGLSLAVRLGCHTGLVVIGEELGGTGHGDMVLGDTPNIAARLEGVAEPNTLVIGALTHQLLGGVFNCRSLGTPPLKGVAAPLEVYRVLNESTALTRLDALGATGLTPLVGRATELQLLEERWSQVLGGRGQVVLVSGEPGIGKSRLVRALTEHAAEQQAWLTPCRASPYHQDTALYPFIDLFERVVLRSEPPGGPADKVRKLEGFLVQNGLSLAEAMPPLCALLSIPPPAEYAVEDLPPDQQKQRTMQALQTILFQRAVQQPVLFVVEDLHWIDPTTVELLTVLVERIHTAPILAVFTYRPDFHPPWSKGPNVTEADLNRLAPSEAAELTRRVAHGKPLPDAIVQEVVSKTDGVPLFVEELTKMLLESGLLAEGTDGYALTAPLPPLAIPNTLHDSLMARLDRLSAVKGLAQLGATIGREFTYPLLRAVAPWDEHVLRDGLAQLVDAEFLHQQGTLPNATYRFKHALIQDASYQSLLKSTRQQHHQRIANTMEASFPEIGANQPELLAHHYTEAGLTEQAIPYWEAAGRRALRRYANHEAANHATRGLELLKTLPKTPGSVERELSLLLVLGPSQSFVDGPQSVEHIYARARELARHVGGTPELFPALAGLAYAQIVRGHLPQARALADEFLELAEPQQDALILAAGHSMLAYAAWWQGDFVDVRDHSRMGLELYNPDQHRAGIAAYNQNPGIICGYLTALSSWVLGYPTQASRAMEQTLAHARELQHPYSFGLTLLFSAQLFQLRREPGPARARAQEAIAVSAEHGLHAVELWCLLPRGWAAVQRGDAAAGIADIREAMDRRRAAGIGAVWPWFLALLADAHGALDQFDAAFGALDEALQWVRDNDERLYAAEAHRIKGELLLRQPTPDQIAAERCFEQALNIARDAEAKSWELRAATSMARMWLQDSRFDDARALLAPAYDWFTEGFDTADLQDAKALLERL
jgi:class 3 adenylate cyclase/tetratricopeptide (TPR) repeat protein